MRWRAWRLGWRARLRRKRVDIVLTHAPPAGYGDADDPAHEGIEALVTLVRRLRPRLLVHGHVRSYGPKTNDLLLGDTLIVNPIPYRLIEL